MLKRFIVAMLLMSIAGAAMAQNNHTLHGSVADAKGESLPFTNCVLLHEADSSFAYGTTGDTEGKFAFGNIATGNYLLRITFMGYLPHWQRLDIKQNTDLGTVVLDKNATLLKEVKITASRPLYSADGEKVFYNVVDDPSVQSGNATDALQNAPGVEVDAEGNIKYRGGAEVSIWINNKPSHLKAESLKQYLKSLPAGTLQRIEVIAHPSAKYHTQNCVVNIVTTAKVKRNELLCLGLNANSRPQVGPWVDYVWSNEKVRFNVFVSGDYDSYSGEQQSDSRLLAPDSALSSTVSTRGHSRNRTLGGNFGLDFDYNIDSNTLVNLWLWTTATHDSSSLDGRTERTEFITAPGRYFYNEKVGNGSLLADASFGVMLEKKLDTLGGMLFVDYTGTLTLNRSLASNLRMHDSLAALDFDRLRTTLNPSQWHGITADIALPYSKHGEVDFGIMASLAPERKEVVAENHSPISQNHSLISSNHSLIFENLGETFENPVGIFDFPVGTLRNPVGIFKNPVGKSGEGSGASSIDPLRSYNYTNGTYELSLYAGAEHHFGRLTLGASLSCDNIWYRLQYPQQDSLGNQISNSQFSISNFQFLNFSPTVHASYSTPAMHNFTFSYTHFVAPPTATQLTRFTVYGYDGYSTGNPDLKNGYTDNLELGWERYFDHLGSIGLSAWYNSMRDQAGTLTDVAYCDVFGRIVAFSQPFNIGTARNGGLGLNATLRPASFMNIRFYANLFDDYYRVQYRPGQWAESEMLCYSLRLNFWAKLWEDNGVKWFDGLQVFANAVYRSRTQTLLAEVDPYFSFDCGVSTDLFDRRLSLFLNVNDLFGTVRTGGESVNPYNPSTSESTLTSQYVSFGLTWRIGRTEMEGMQKHGKKSAGKRKGARE